jgi:hypothetical protein
MTAVRTSEVPFKLSDLNSHRCFRVRIVLGRVGEDLVEQWIRIIADFVMLRVVFIVVGFEGCAAVMSVKDCGFVLSIEGCAVVMSIKDCAVVLSFNDCGFIMSIRDSGFVLSISERTVRVRLGDGVKVKRGS